MENLSHSRLRTLKSCPWKYNLKYRYDIAVTETPEALSIGSAIHKYRELVTSGAASPLVALRGDYYSAPPTDPEKRQKYDLAWFKVIAMISAHDWRWKEYEDKIETVATELKFELPLFNPASKLVKSKSRSYQVVGQIDRIVKLPGGNLAVWEYKTSSEDLSPGSAYWKRLRMESQASLCFYAAKQLGYNVTSVVYDVFGKPKIQPRFLTQSETERVINEGRYTTAVVQGGEFVEIAAGLQVDWPDDMPTDYDPENGPPDHYVINGENAEVKPGKKGFAIRETATMYSRRYFQLLMLEHEKYMQRREIPRNAGDIAKIEKNLWTQGKILNERKKMDFWDFHEESCHGFGTCEYFPLCSEDFRPGDVLPEGFKIEKRSK